ncbi:MAG: hypothetical protein JO126_07920 [Alphaproteobacteria bacterium]|nr:hypothetical protein [Alphaproteobacteria bacterium]MBV8549366.1 hypothetical protein [Alphaproteobacteria bacterium]
MADNYLKPMLDPGSARVFNINVMTRRLMSKDPAAKPFFNNPKFNVIVLIKDTVPEAERKGNVPPIGTKLYIPFNEHDIYEGGRTIFLHNQHLQQALTDQFGVVTGVTPEMLLDDMNKLKVLDSMPSLDPFLLKDLFMRSNMTVNELYFEISQEQWHEIELYILQRFEPLVKAAYPDAMQFDEKARQLIGKIWEANDMTALQPLIEAFRFPTDRALEIFGAWKGINYYSFQHTKLKKQLLDMATWLKTVAVPPGVMSRTESMELMATLNAGKEAMLKEWQKVEGILRSYNEGYDKMFKEQAGSTQFLDFLRNSARHYWDLGNSMGRISHVTYCWHVYTGRYKDRKLPWPETLQTIKLFTDIMTPDRKANTAMAW